MHFLVVEDGIDIAEWLAEELTLKGHDVYTTYDGPTGVELCQELEPDVVVADIALPGMNGWEVARRIRKLGLARQPRLIAISALQQEPHLDRSRVVGFEAHLVKPVRIEELERVLAAPPKS